jgi:hypothetical protein
MNATPRSFSRVVLGLQTIAPPHSVRLAVDFAGLLRADILGLFVEDRALHDFAQLPFARELSILGGDWRPIERDRLSEDLDIAIRKSRRAFRQATSTLSPASHFEIIRDSAAIESLARPGDVVVVLEPSAPADRIAHQFSSLLEAAFRSGAAMMFVPQRVARTDGPVLMLATSQDETRLRPAARLAAALASDLVVEPHGQRHDNLAVQCLAAKLGIRIQSSAPATALVPHQAPAERLIVAGRDTLDINQVPQIAALRAVPVLIMDACAGSEA